MRSAVSAILSDTQPEMSWCYPDYAQTAFDHRKRLILVQHVGNQITPQAFQKIHDQIAKQHEVVVNDRRMHFRFLKSYPVENNEWGEFQFHRQLVGFIAVGACRSQQEMMELVRLQESVKEKYAKTIVDTRLIVFGFDEKPAFDDDSPTTSKGIIFYDGEDQLKFDNEIREFLTLTVLILDSKRLNTQCVLRSVETNEKQDKLPMLCAPFERKDFVGLDLDSRQNKKKTLGRYKKHMGDLNLICGYMQEAHECYETASDILKNTNDWLWLANALEGLCAVSVMILYPSLNRLNEQLHRNSSFKAVSEMTFNNKTVLHERDNMFKLRPLRPHDINDKYREIVVHYSKYRHAGIIETEASIKAVQVLTEQKNYLLAAEFLQNIVFINLQMNDDEKIQRFTALAHLYSSIGFHRKSGFFRRVAAMRCVAPQNPHPNWALCYQLLMQTISGYCLDLCDREHDSNRGWPTLQIQILQELVGTARRTSNHSAATRHMTFLVQNLFHSLSQPELNDFCQQLSVLTSKSPGTPTSIALDNGLILPPVNVFNVPIVESFSVSTLPYQLSPVRRKLSSENQPAGPFLFTPIQSRDKSRNISWVQGDVCTVSVRLVNPLPTDLKVIDLCLLHEGVDFEPFPLSLLLNSDSSPIEVSLTGVPKATGELRLIGYSCTVMGVKSLCRLKYSPYMDHDEVVVDVVPSLPQLQLTLTEEEESRNLMTFTDKNIAQLSLFYGESVSMGVSLTSVGKVSVDDISINCDVSPSDVADQIQIMTLSGDRLPLQPGESSHMLLKVTGHFPMGDECEGDAASTHSGQSSVYSRFSQRPPAVRSSAGSGLSSLQSELPVGKQQKRRKVDITLKIDYSGGVGLAQGFQRTLVQKIELEILPSVRVCKWDVLPSESLDECYVVFDAMNQTEYELELRYTPQKTIVMETGDFCRLPIPVQKLPLAPPSEHDEDWKRGECAKYLASVIKLEWSIPSYSDRCGTIDLRNLKLSPKMIEGLEISPVTWSLSLNDRPHTDDANFSVGDKISFTAVVTCTQTKLRQCSVKVLCQKDDSDRRSSHVLMTNSNVKRFPEISADREARYNCVIIPMVSGTYNIDCTLFTTDKVVTAHPTVAIHVQ